MFITGPDVIRTVTGEEVGFEELGGAMTHNSTSGVAHFACEDEEQCLADARYLLSFLPSNNLETAPRVLPTDDPQRMDEALDHVVPAHPNKPYDMREVVRPIVDDGEFYEVHEHYATNIVCGFARLDGYAVGVVGNQPMSMAGVLDIDASVKAARFVRTCDAFNVPLLTFVDVPGFLPGIEQEWGGIIRHGAKLLYAFTEATVPKITVITRKAYGGAYDVMASKHLGADFNLAWPTAEVAVMGPEGAVSIIYKRDIAGSPTPEARRDAPRGRLPRAVRQPVLGRRARLRRRRHRPARDAPEGHRRAAGAADQARVAAEAQARQHPAVASPCEHATTGPSHRHVICDRCSRRTRCSRSCASPARRCASRRSTCRASGTTRRSPRSCCGWTSPACCTRSPTASPRRRCTTCSPGCGRRSSAPARSACGRCRRCSGRRRSRSSGRSRAGSAASAPALVAAAIVAVNPMLVWFSQEARAYALLALLAALAALLWLRALERPRRRARGGMEHRRRARGRDALLRDLPRRARRRCGSSLRLPGARARAAALAPLGLALVALAPLALGQRANDSAVVHRRQRARDARPPGPQAAARRLRLARRDAAGRALGRRARDRARRAVGAARASREAAGRARGGRAQARRGGAARPRRGGRGTRGATRPRCSPRSPPPRSSSPRSPRSPARTTSSPATCSRSPPLAAALAGAGLAQAARRWPAVGPAAIASGCVLGVARGRRRRDRPAQPARRLARRRRRPRLHRPSSGSSPRRPAPRSRRCATTSPARDRSPSRPIGTTEIDYVAHGRAQPRRAAQAAAARRAAAASRASSSWAAHARETFTVLRLRAGVPAADRRQHAGAPGSTAAAPVLVVFTR